MELVSHIVDEVSNDAGMLPAQRIRTLQNCALSHRSFACCVARHTFKTVKFTQMSGEESKGTDVASRIHLLADIIRGNRRIGSAIQSLAIELQVAGEQLVLRQNEDFQAIIPSLDNLHSFSLAGTPAFERYWAKVQTEVYYLLHDLFRKNSNTLSTVELRRISNFPLDLLIGCTSLQSLTCDQLCCEDATSRKENLSTGISRQSVRIAMLSGCPDVLSRLGYPLGGAVGPRMDQLESLRCPFETQMDLRYLSRMATGVLQFLHLQCKSSWIPKGELLLFSEF